MIAIGLGVLTALAFSSAPHRVSYLANYTLVFTDGSHTLSNHSEIVLVPIQYTNASSSGLMHAVYDELTVPVDGNITNLNLAYISTHIRCFADTSIISEATREILRHISNKLFFISIGIVTIFYSITFVLALHRQNPRIRALKKSLHVLNKFNSSSSYHDQMNNRSRGQRTDSLVSTYSTIFSSVRKHQAKRESKHLSSSTDENQISPTSNFINDDDFAEQNILNEQKDDFHMSRSETASDDLQAATEKFSNLKQVSFQIQDNSNTIINNDNQQLSFITNSFETNLSQNTDTYYKFSCPCLKTRQFFIKFHFSHPNCDIHQWFCCSPCYSKGSSLSSNDHELSMIASPDDETSNILPSSLNNSQAQSSLISNSAIIRKQLHRHRLKQVRMASTFLLITVSFVVFYLPSILNAERYIKSPIMIYYLYLCTHALNPIIYCFMNRSLRDYLCAILRCESKYKDRNLTCGPTTVYER